MDVVSSFLDDCFITLCIPSKNCGIVWGASCIILNCHHCICKKNGLCRNNPETVTETYQINRESLEMNNNISNRYQNI